jgi:rod shape-determining protein MreC
VAEFSPVVAPEGLIGVVLSVSRRSSVAMSWAHPEFRVSAFTVSGNAFGVVAPSNEGRNGEGALEFRGVPYRDSVPLGTLVLSSGLGGVFPKGIPVGTVIGTVREEAGWERVYRLRPAANPGSAAHVLVLVGGRPANLTSAFPSDSLLEAMRLDSIARIHRADSLAKAARAARAARRDSLARVSPLQGGTVIPPVQRTSPMQGGAPAAPLPAPADSAP